MTRDDMVATCLLLGGYDYNLDIEPPIFRWHGSRRIDKVIVREKHTRVRTDSSSYTLSHDEAKNLLLELLSRDS